MEQITQKQNLEFILFKKIFWAILHGMQDPSSSARD